MLHFDKLQSKVSQWWTFYSDRTKIKSLFRRWKNVVMVSEKLFRNTLSKQFIVFVLYKPQYLSKVHRSILTSSGTHDNLKVFCKCSTSARSLSAWLSRVFAWKKRPFAAQCTSNRRKIQTYWKTWNLAWKLTSWIAASVSWRILAILLTNVASHCIKPQIRIFLISAEAFQSHVTNLFCKSTFSQKSKKNPTKSMNSHQKAQEYIKGKSPLFIL